MVMKILDWMHRKLHPVTNYSRVSHRKASAFEEDAGELTESVLNSAAAAEFDQDTEESLLFHVLNGILSIGTLGHPHPILLPCHSFEQEEPEFGLPEKPLTTVEKPPARITLLQPAVEMFKVKTEQFDLTEEKIMAEVPLLKEDRERKERTTLADLLAAEVAATVGDEASIVGKYKRAIAVLNFSTVSTSTVKSGDVVNKKLEKKNKVYEVDPSHSSGSTKRIRRIITRMVKKKIHPEAPAEKAGGVAVMGLDPLLLSDRGGGVEAA